MAAQPATSKFTIDLLAVEWVRKKVDTSLDNIKIKANHIHHRDETGPEGVPHKLVLHAIYSEKLCLALAVQESCRLSYVTELAVTVNLRDSK